MFQNKLVSLFVGATVINALTNVGRMFRRIDFKNRVVVITGGSRGLGLVLARRRGKEKAKLVLLARDSEELESAQDELKRKRVDARVVVCDMTVQEDVEAAMALIAEEMGGIDVLINNAGIIQVGPFDTMTMDDFREAFETHFWGSLYATLAVVPYMKEKKFGRIVNIASVGGKISVPHLLPYNASKFALAGLSEGLRYELMPENIFVTSVYPGLMRTGSHINAKFKGQHSLEYALFSTLNSLPFLSANANSAASEIVEACRFGDAELIITVPAQFIAKFRALFPEATSHVLSTVTRFLPKNGANGEDIKSGQESKSKLSPNPLTHLADEAAKENNEETASTRS